MSQFLLEYRVRKRWNAWSSCLESVIPEQISTRMFGGPTWKYFVKVMQGCPYPCLGRDERRGGVNQQPLTPAKAGVRT